jgi:hypothetical protein
MVTCTRDTEMCNQEVITITDKSKNEVVKIAKQIRQLNSNVARKEYGPYQVCGDDDDSWHVKFYFVRGTSRLPN